MDILKYRDGLIGKEGAVYVGRPKKYEYKEGELLIGLGNPFSWKQSQFVKFQVKNLEECLVQYRAWLYKLVKMLVNIDEEKINTLSGWEVNYCHKFVDLAKAIEKAEVDSLVCWCTNIKGYSHELDDKGKEVCHAQILYKACIWYNQAKVCS